MSSDAAAEARRVGGASRPDPEHAPDHGLRRRDRIVTTKLNVGVAFEDYLTPHAKEAT